MHSDRAVTHDMSKIAKYCAHVAPYLGSAAICGALALVTQTTTRVCAEAMQNVCRWCADGVEI